MRAKRPAIHNDRSHRGTVDYLAPHQPAQSDWPSDPEKGTLRLHHEGISAERAIGSEGGLGANYLARFSINLLRTSTSWGSGAPGHRSPIHRFVIGSGSLRKLNTDT
jgi:hypothetical protein